MASLDKLSIRGVRAFSPDDDEQVIQFMFPLTVIVGENGCGKTTIIESLKYAVTGSLPPGNRSGQAFVHDPRSIGQTNVKASIKLRFTNKAGLSMVVVRSMEVTQKKTTMSFKALDGIIRTHDQDTGEKVALSHKCSELDRLLPTYLGVSKPVLEHVVFCHQEDASWPLMEGAVLKKRFDDIFDSTRYAKALESIRKSKLEYTSIAKELQGDLKGLSSHKHAAKGFRKELDDNVARLDELEEDIRACGDEIKQAEERKARANAIIAQVDDISSELETKKTELNQEQSMLEKQRSLLEKDWTKEKSLRDLKNMLRDLEAERNQRLEKQDSLEGDCVALRKDMEKIRHEDLSLRGKLGKLAAEREAHEDMKKRRWAKMEDIATTYNMDLSITQTQASGWAGGTQSTLDSQTTLTGGTQESFVTISKEDMDAFYRALEAKEEECKENLQLHRRQSQKQEDELQKTLSEFHASLKAIENDCKKMTEEIIESRNEMNTLSTQSTGHPRVRKSNIEAAKTQAARFAKELEEANNDPELTNIPTKIRSLEGKMDKLKREIEYDQEALRDLRRCSDAQNEVKILKDQIVKDIENLRELLHENSFVVQRFNIQVHSPLPGSNDGDDPNGEELSGAMETAAVAVHEKYDSSTQDLSKANDDLASKQHLVSEKSGLLSHSRSSLTSIRHKIETLSADNGSMRKFGRIVAAIKRFEAGAGATLVGDTNDPHKVLQHLTSRIEAIEASEREDVPAEVISLVIEKLSSIAHEENVCPCCRRDIKDIKAAKAFKKAMAQMKDPETSDLIKTDRSKAEKDQAAKTNYSRWRKEVTEVMNDVLDHNRLVAEANSMENTIREMETEVTTLENELRDLKTRCSELQSEANDLRELSDAAKRWTEDASRIASKKAGISLRLTDLSINTSDAHGGRDLKTVEEDLLRKQTEKEKFMDEITKLNKESMALNDLIAKKSIQVRRSDENLKKMEKQYQEEQQTSIRRAELNERVNKLQEQESKLREQIAPLKQKIRTKESDKSRMRTQASIEEGRLSEILSKFVASVNELRSLTSQIESYTSSDKSAELDGLNEEIASLEVARKEKEKELIVKEPELERLMKSIDDEERQKKIVGANIDLINAGHRVEELKKAIETIQEDLEQVEGRDSCEADYRAAEQRRTELLHNKARLEGRRSGFVETIRGLKRKLKTPEYLDIDERHRVLMIRVETTLIAVDDMGKYYNALDSALLRYHSTKINEINKLIRELWTLTYKGQDISNIAIVSGQESGSKAKRSYNYRVVMTKGGQQLDMRGRCSAGQRVLASIVIRLALAEVFCLHCGCMALDEPTVNLDHNNKRGLATALSQIIGSRAQQSNFQLIVITHDEDFVGMMKTELNTLTTNFQVPEKYFQIRREAAADGKYYSKIYSPDWDDLLTST